ncbi:MULTISPECIES: hypothetical protein [Ferrimonas]|uniref:hypothetical protein n=1 Tax=Ferrimonas TaxID=44011 RepID=UPI000487D29A|nr:MULTISPECIES: hypothetical protein [Ferrimonas]USD37295.1 hypothetical protein J8Z22_20305 [Ferrimonas sp. SCSIO 43195]
MFSRDCPHCKSSIDFSYIKKFVDDERIPCPHCHRVLRVSPVASLINSVFIGLVVGGALGLFTDIRVDFIVVIGGLVTVFFQKYLDVFFSLVEDKS